MARRKRKLTSAQKRAKRERKKKFMTIFINGKQKSVPRPEMIEGLPVDEFIRRNADPIWLHQNEMWELMEPAWGYSEFDAYDRWFENLPPEGPENEVPVHCGAGDAFRLDSRTRRR